MFGVRMKTLSRIALYICIATAVTAAEPYFPKDSSVLEQEWCEASLDHESQFSLQAERTSRMSLFASSTCLRGGVPSHYVTRSRASGSFVVLSCSLATADTTPARLRDKTSAKRSSPRLMICFPLSRSQASGVSLRSRTMFRDSMGASLSWRSFETASTTVSLDGRRRMIPRSAAWPAYLSFLVGCSGRPDLESRLHIEPNHGFERPSPVLARGPRQLILSVRRQSDYEA